MKVKKILNSIVGFHVLRHRHHKRLLHNALLTARQFGPGKGLLMLGAMALGGYYLQKRNAHRHEQLAETTANF